MQDGPFQGGRKMRLGGRPWAPCYWSHLLPRWVVWGGGGILYFFLMFFKQPIEA